MDFGTWELGLYFFFAGSLLLGITVVAKATY
jgi:hypothetical protein